MLYVEMFSDVPEVKCCADRDLMFPMAGFQPPSAISGEVSQHGTSIKTIGFSGQKGRAWGCKFYEKTTSKHCKLRCCMAPTCLKPR